MVDIKCLLHILMKIIYIYIYKWKVYKYKYIYIYINGKYK